MSAWYRSGTIAVAGKTVTGTGTNWKDNKAGIGEGQALLIPGAGTVKVYEIARVDSATQLTLTDDAGNVAAGQAYAIMSFYANSVPDFSRRLAAQLSYYQSQMDGWQEIMTGTGSITLEAPDGLEVTISSMKKLTDDMDGKANKINGTVPKSEGGTGLKSPFGNTEGTFCEGDDPRLNSVDGNLGGQFNGAVAIGPSGNGVSHAFIIRSATGAGNVLGSSVTKFIDGSTRQVLNITGAEGGRVSSLYVDAGIVCKAGYNGAVALNTYSVNWTGSQPQLWIDNLNWGTIATSPTSDKELKQDIEYVTENEPGAEDKALEEVMQWKVARFRYKSRGPIPASDVNLGFIANDQVVFSPETVKGKGLQEDYDELNPADAYFLDEIALIAKLTLALQVQRKELNNLKDILEGNKIQ